MADEHQKQPTDRQPEYFLVFGDEVIHWRRRPGRNWPCYPPKTFVFGDDDPGEPHIVGGQSDGPGH